MKDKIKKIVCEMMSGDGDLMCDNCLDMYQNQCKNYVNKLLSLLKEK